MWFLMLVVGLSLGWWMRGAAVARGVARPNVSGVGGSGAGDSGRGDGTVGPRGEGPRAL